MAEIKEELESLSMKVKEESEEADLTLDIQKTKITANCRKFFKRWEYQTTWPASWEICMQVKKQ